MKAYFKTIEGFSIYMNAYNDDECLEYKPVKKYNDDTLKKIIHKAYNINYLVELPIQERSAIIKKIYNEAEIRIRQLSRVLEIGKAVVEKAIK